MKLIGRSDLKTSYTHYICEEHFAADCFTPNMKMTKDALPSLKLPPHSMDSAVMLHKSTQCRPQEATTKTNKQQKTANGPTSSKKPIETFNELCDKYLGPEIAHIIKANVDVKHKILHDRFTTINHDFKHFCLKFYYTSPASYSGLQKSLNLPDKKTLSRMLMSAIEGDHEKLITTLKAKVDCMSDLEKNCSILIGFVEVKPHLFYHINEDKIYGFSESYGVQKSELAEDALVIFARGIYEPWVLAIDYALFPKDGDTNAITCWIRKTISDVLHVGLNVRVCISNLSPDIIAASPEPASASTEKPAPVSIEKPFFSVDKKQIYYTIDPSYLIKKIHSCFMEYEFHFCDTVARWQDIVNFYNRDSKKKLRLAPKLTEEHVKCSSSREIPFSYVINTLSESVAAGISTYIEFGAMNVAAVGTVRFLTIISKLIDFTHSCNADHYREFKRPFDGSIAQLSFFSEVFFYFRCLKVVKNNVDVTDRMEFITDFQMAIRSLLMLSEDLKFENYPNLFTRNINFNFISNFFHSVSKKNYRSGELLPWRLATEFRSRFSRHILRTPKHRYCPEVLNGIFFEYLSSSHLLDPEVNAMKVPAYPKPFKAGHLSLRVRMSDYKDIDLPRKEQMSEIGIFVLNKCLEKHPSCTLPGRQRKRDIDNDDDPDERYKQYKFEPVKKRFIPDQHFMLFLWELETELKNYLETNFINMYFLRSLDHRSETTLDSFKPPCICFPVMYLKTLFFRLRMSQILRINNRTFKKGAKNLCFRYKILP